MATFLNLDSIEWALTHLDAEGDGDLFPKPFEASFLLGDPLVTQAFRRIDLETHQWRTGRRMLIPKNYAQYRAATQLDLIDTVLLTATVHQYGASIERHRASEDTVFSYRFSPTPNGRLYKENIGWREFWQTSLELARTGNYTHVVRADISDFYNQIYHHTLENQLDAAGVPSAVVKSLIRFAGTLTQKVSRGLPVGPHFAHLLADVTLTPCDRALSAKATRALRFVDDFHLLATSEDDARVQLQLLAETLDSQQRSALQSAKTQILTIEQFAELAERLGDDIPRSDAEEDLLELIDSKTDSSPYDAEAFDFDSLTEDEAELLSEDNLRNIIEGYLGEDTVDFWRLGWILRRISQTGTANALSVVLENITHLVPVMGSVARYILHCRNDPNALTHALGSRIAKAISDPYIRRNKYIQIVLANILAEQPSFNNVATLTAQYEMLPVEVRREVLLAAKAATMPDWIREQKEQFDGDPWLRRALIMACVALPEDEASFWIKSVRGRLSGLDALVAAKTFPNVLKMPQNFSF